MQATYTGTDRGADAAESVIQAPAAYDPFRGAIDRADDAAGRARMTDARGYIAYMRECRDTADHTRPQDTREDAADMLRQCGVRRDDTATAAACADDAGARFLADDARAAARIAARVAAYSAAYSAAADAYAADAEATRAAAFTAYAAGADPRESTRAHTAARDIAAGARHDIASAIAQHARTLAHDASADAARDAELARIAADYAAEAAAIARAPHTLRAAIAWSAAAIADAEGEYTGYAPATRAAAAEYAAAVRGRPQDDRDAYRARIAAAYDAYADALREDRAHGFAHPFGFPWD